jgi:hypothetical protein
LGVANVAVGSITSFLACLPDVRFTPHSDRIDGVIGRRLVDS